MALFFPTWAAAQEVCLTAEQYAAITYSWTGADGVTHNDVPITEKATDPDQIYELLRTIYCDERVPGPQYTAYDRNGNRENPTFYGKNEGGWNIIATEPTTQQLRQGYKKVTAPAASNEGYTVLMVALKNDCAPAYTDNQPHHFSNTSQLINYIGNNIESVELLTDGLRLGSGENRGTVFNISGTYNKFFFLSKGRARDNRDKGKGYEVPFEDMFEQFSPTDGESQLGSDYYEKLSNGEQYEVQHDCSSVMENKHYFTMSGETGTTYYNVDGLNFFIPDYRLKYNGTTSKGADKRTTYYQNIFVGYYAAYQVHLPSTMLYSIKLEAKRSAEVVDGNYTVTLNWKSSLDEQNGEPLHQQFYVYRYVMDPETGVKSRELLAEVEGKYTQPTYGYEWEYQVPQEVSSYLITYVVTGKPIDEQNEENSYKFKDTDSNDAQVAIPGTDKLEALELTIEGGYISTYNVDQEANKYKNYVNMSQGLGSTKLTANHLNGTTTNNPGQTTFELYRYNNQTSDSVKVADLVVTKTYSSRNRSYSFTWKITYNTASQRSDASGYPTTSGSLTNVSDPSAVLNFGTIQFCDMFEASTDANDHPNQYKYRVYFDAAAAMAANGEKRGHSNIITVPVQKTELTIKGAQYTHDDVYVVDDDHSLEVNTTNVEMSVKAYDDNILRYEIDRGVNGNKPVLDNPIVGAQRLSSGGGYQPLVRSGNDLIEQGDEQYMFNGANYVDVPLTDEASQEGITSYVPIVRTYRPEATQTTSEKYNTYGAPIETFALGKIVSITPMANEESDEIVTISDYTWSENGIKYCYYDVKLLIDAQIPEGYEAVGFRAWRTCDKAHESCKYTTAGEPQFIERILNRQNMALDPDKGYMLEFNTDANESFATISPNVILGKQEISHEGLSDDVVIGPEYTGTFGAPMITHRDKNGTLMQGSIDELEITYRVRMYYKQKSQGGNHIIRRAGENETREYFVAEKEFTMSVNASNVITSVMGVKSDAEVQSVMYYNTVGMASTQPWSGVNIAVTRYTDGTTRTAKVVR